MTRRFVGTFGTLALALLAFGSARADDKAATLGGSDKSFVMEAAEGGQSEVELGQLAKDKGQSEAVKQFGQHMVDDHSKANSELSDLAGRKGVTVSTTLSAKHKSQKDKLSKLSGADFDKQYMREMVKDHEEDVAAFQKEANKGKDAELVAWAKQTLPTLQQHLTMAREAEAQVKGKPASK